MKEVSASTSNAFSINDTPFNTYIHHLTRQNQEEAKTYWEKRFADLSNTRLFPQSQDPDHQPLATDSLHRILELQHSKRQVHLQGKTDIVAQTGWALTICQYTANSDTLFGTILSGRESAAASIEGIEAIVGPTITTVPVRTIFNYDSSVSDLITAVQDDNLNAIRFSHIGLAWNKRLV
ncbi:Apicidin F synthase [Fusarium musae]|uniref:Apicidin F synthase n=1 Tax=Fusarium musae TaxID=1042133 RepID=A0A9P8D3J5_9HYPO|nr:Apicidin F synthase [Fusarium musae]KAG9494702.1 Apicidin F synthase [Fusarium musae]